MSTGAISSRGATSPAPRPAGGLATIVRIGLRELRSGIRGFQVFIACLALGVMVIAAVGSMSDALRSGLARQGELLLGGDLTFGRMHIRATDAERAVLDGLGSISETATMRTMARTLDVSEQALAELKSADAAYPLAGTVELEDGGDFQAALAENGAVVDPMLLKRLGVSVGDTIRIADAEVVVRGLLKSEPDGVTDRLTYGPRVFISADTLEKTGLIQPGMLIRWRYALRLPAGGSTSPEALKVVGEDLKAALPDAGFTVRDRHDPDPQVRRTLDRLRQFLILIGLASLLVGGVGIANAVATFIDKRVRVIATLRSIGATGRQVFGIFLVQIVAMTLIGILIGLGLGVLVPLGINALYGDQLPVRGGFGVSLQSLGVAGLYGLVVALLFALWPLGRAEGVHASVLFRDQLASSGGRPRGAVIAATVALVAVLLAIALTTSDPRWIALYVTAGLMLMLAVFGALGVAVTRLARRLPRLGSPMLGLAIRNIAAPDGLTRSVVLSLGTGLTLLVAVALVNASLVSELKERLPEQSPDYFLLDVPKDSFAPLVSAVRQRIEDATFSEAAMLRGRIVKLNDTLAEDYKPPADAQWVLNGERGLSYAVEVPEGSVVSAGEWWPADYDGPPLVSFEAELAERLGLTVGDRVTVNVLGRNIEARIANVRDVKWESLAINFVLVFSPNTLQAAPHNMLATIRIPSDTPAADEAEMMRELGRSFPSVTAIRVRDALDQVNKIFAKVMVAVQIAGSVTLAAGALVLAGALATAQRRRILEAVILKTLGARRRQILAAHAYEYALLAAIAALVAIGLGALVAWIAVTQVMSVTFVFSLPAIFMTLAVAGLLIALFGGIGTWSVLRAPAVPYLKSE
jgi:putative ABC transport system permease protein